MREKKKIREIERTINKKFERGEMPTGEQICAKQLFNFIDQIEKVKVDEEEIAALMPQVYRKLEWLDKEDVIKRMVSLELNRMIDYYKDAEEIEVVDEKSSKEARAKRRKGEAEEGYVRFFINFGKFDGLYPNTLISLINRCVPGKVAVGRIDLRDRFSFFEVKAGEAEEVMELMNGYEVDGRRISVELAQEDKKGKDRKPKRSKPTAQRRFERFSKEGGKKKGKKRK